MLLLNELLPHTQKTGVDFENFIFLFAYSAF